METTQSIEIIEKMFSESKKSLHNYSFYFITWATVLIPASIAEFIINDPANYWFIWPVAGILGGIACWVYSARQNKTQGVTTATDRIYNFTWGGFGFALVFAIIFSVYNRMSPHSLILMLAGLATFITGGIARFNPFIYGSLVMQLMAIGCAFFVPMEYHPILFSVGILFGYLIPAILLRKKENG